MNGCRLGCAEGEVLTIRGKTILNGGRDRIAEPFAIQLLRQGCRGCADNALHILHTNIFCGFFKIISSQVSLGNKLFPESRIYMKVLT